MQTETQFKEKVMKDLNLPGVYVLKTQERARKGIADLLICWQGQFIAIELKRDGEKPTKLQSFFLDTIIAAGGIAFYTTPNMWAVHLSTLKGTLSS